MRPEQEFFLGAKPYRPDERDYLYRDAALGAAFAESRRFWGMVGPQFRINQGGEGTCVAHGATNVLLASPTEHELYPPFATPETAHDWARALYLEASGDATYQEGMYPRDVCVELLDRGLISSYHRAATVTECLDALLTTGPLMFASPWWSSMDVQRTNLQDRIGKWYVKVNPDSDLRGFHLYALTGIDLAPDKGPPFVRMENSWGPTWADNGTGRIAIDDLNILYDGDAWVMVEAVF
jgi:hypothetical protein